MTTLPSWVPPKVTQLFNMAIGEYGQDYAVPVGTPIYSPVAGIFGSEDKGKADWGKRAFVHATSGLSFAVGHLSQFAAVPGQKIKVGDLIGYSGGAKSDPSSGESTGPHVETQFMSYVGGQLQYLDPRNVFAKAPDLQQLIFKGAAGIAGAPAAAATSAANSALSAIGDAFAAAISGFQGQLLRGFWVLLGIGLFGFGVFLILLGDIERVGEKVADVAADVAAPEVALPAQAAAAAAKQKETAA